MDTIKSVRVFIYGSCVSRDVISFDISGELSLVSYIARSPLASAVASKRPNIVVDMERNDSAFQRRMIAADIEKSLVPDLQSSQFDILLMDLIDERINLVKAKNGGILAYSNELQRTGYRFTSENGELISAFSEESYSNWESAWKYFFELAVAGGFASKLRVIEAHWARNEDGTIPTGYDEKSLETANKWLARAYERIRHDLFPNQIIELKKECHMADPKHIWGNSPFHYVRDYYEAVLSSLKVRHKAPLKDPAEHVGLTTVNFGRIRVGSHGLHLSGLTDADSFEVRLRVNDSSLGTESKLLVAFGGLEESCKFAIDNSLVKSHREHIGHYKYLTRQVDGKFSASFCCGRGVRVELGIFIYNQNEIEVFDLVVDGFCRLGEQVVRPLISVDVEALPHRASEDHVNRLIFGKISDGEYGVRRLCEIFRDYRIAATFFVEVAGTSIYGDGYLARLKDILDEFGQDAGLHIHPELFKRSGVLKLNGGFEDFSDISYDDAARIIEYGKSRFISAFGSSRPIMFRPGAMKISPEMYEACAVNGIIAASGLFRGDRDGWGPRTVQNGHFNWDNGILEIPLDLALDPLKSIWTKLPRFIEARKSLACKSKFLSILVHSWSLLERNAAGHHDRYCEQYEATLRGYLSRLELDGQFITHEQAVREVVNGVNVGGPPVPLQALNVAKESVKFTGATEMSWRRIPYKHDGIGDRRISALSLPMTNQDNINMHYFFDGEKIVPVYITNGRARILVVRIKIKNFVGLIYEILKVDKNLLISGVKLLMGEAQKRSCLNTNKCGEQYILALPKSFAEYRANIVSKKLLGEIEREFRRCSRESSLITIDFLEGDDLTPERFIAVFEAINQRLNAKGAGGYNESWISANYELFHSRGMLCELSAGGSVRSCCAFLMDVDQVHYFSAAITSTEDDGRNVSYGKMLLFSAIEKFIERGYSSINLGGGNYGYKSRLGGASCPIFEIEYRHDDDVDSPEKAAFLIFDGVSINSVERQMGGRLEQLFGYQFFNSCLGLDFDTAVSTASLGLDSSSKAYQVSIDSAVFGLLDAIPESVQGMGFADVGCGKGKVLYYAQPYSFTRYLGVEISPMLCEVATRNLGVLGLEEVKILNKDASKVEAADLSAIGVFFLYNPFTGWVIEAFAKAVIGRCASDGMPACICYLNSVHGNVLEGLGFIVYKKFEKSVGRWRFDDSAIYIWYPPSDR